MRLDAERIGLCCAAGGASGRELGVLADCSFRGVPSEAVVGAAGQLARVLGRLVDVSVVDSRSCTHQTGAGDAGESEESDQSEFHLGGREVWRVCVLLLCCSLEVVRGRVTREQTHSLRDSHGETMTPEARRSQRVQLGTKGRSIGRACTSRSS